MANAVAVFTPGQRITGTDGVPVPFATVRFYEAGSETPKAVYADPDLTVELGHVVYSDAGGYPVASESATSKTLVYATSGTYKVRGFDEAGVVLFEHDNVKGAVIPGVDAGGSSGITQDEADVRYVRNPNSQATVTGLGGTDKISAYVGTASGNRAITWDDLQTDLLGEWKTAGHVYAAGVRVVFQQTSAPTGWVKETNAAYNNVGLRLTTGTVSTGGSVAFDTVFSSQALSGTVGNDTPSITKMAAHSHAVTVDARDTSGGTGSVAPASGAVVDNKVFTSASTGGGAAHNHSLTMNNLNLALKYAGVTIGQKS